MDREMRLGAVGDPVLEHRAMVPRRLSRRVEDAAQVVGGRNTADPRVRVGLQGAFDGVLVILVEIVLLSRPVIVGLAADQVDDRPAGVQLLVEVVHEGPHHLLPLGVIVRGHAVPVLVARPQLSLVLRPG